MQKVIAVVGPTSSGKTALGIFLAKKLDGEVVSCDSRQLYRGMDIIAATPSKREMDGVVHHMLRIADPKRQFSAGAFQKQASKHVSAISKRNRMPIVVGGTGFYAESLLGETPLPQVSPDNKLRAQLQKKSPDRLFAQLLKLDPRRARNIDAHNPVRLIRAIEIAQALGKVPELTRNHTYDVLWLGLQLPPQKHKKAIELRVRERLSTGMLREAQKLRDYVSKKRLAALGKEYVFLADYLDKKISRDELVKNLISWELSYAKRQLRFLRRNKNILWVKNKTDALRLSQHFLAQ